MYLILVHEKLTIDSISPYSRHTFCVIFPSSSIDGKIAAIKAIICNKSLLALTNNHALIFNETLSLLSARIAAASTQKSCASEKTQEPRNLPALTRWVDPKTVTPRRRRRRMQAWAALRRALRAVGEGGR